MSDHTTTQPDPLPMGVTEVAPCVSVIIVNFEAGEYLTKAVESTLRENALLEVIIVDNHSKDNSLDLVAKVACDPRVKIIRLDDNYGFSRAANVGINQAIGDYTLLLNPDCVLAMDSLQKMVAHLDRHPDVPMAGCLIRNPDGSEQPGCRRNIPTPLSSLEHFIKLKRYSRHQVVLSSTPLPKEPVFIDAISGAFMFFRRQELIDLGLFDEQYFMHCEDLDLCMRIKRANKKILFIPEVDVIHYKGKCSEARPLFVEWHKHKGMSRFYKKFYDPVYSLPIKLLVKAGIWARFSLLSAKIAISKLSISLRH